MKVLVLGADGYIGWPLTNALLNEGHHVFCCDNYSRRRRVEELGSNSLIPIRDPGERKHYLQDKYEGRACWINLSLGEDGFSYIQQVLSAFSPEVIVHLAQQPSAPWSMRGAAESCVTQQQNVIGTLQLLWAMKMHTPHAHLIKIGSMGEYGTPNCVIPEGTIPFQCLGEGCISESSVPAACPMSDLPFPRSPNSFYHLSKVHDTHNLIFSCRTWGLRATDIMQGIVYGALEGNRFDYDECFGTVINRFCAQAIIEYPLTVYGDGGQTRGFLPLKDSLQCLFIALNNPPGEGTYRVWNQYESTYNISELATMVAGIARSFGLDVETKHLKNPRTEDDSYHNYNPVCETLFDLGYEPTENIADEVAGMIELLLPYASRVKEHIIAPRINWK